MLGELLGAGISAVSSIFGGDKAADAQEKANKQNIKMQKQFAKNAIQWKVKDASKAGIHPLYALGANTVSFSPSTVGSTALGEGIANAGQNIGRAVASGLSSNERTSGILEKLAIERAQLENTKLASEIALINQPGTPPPPITETAVIPGQGNSVKTVPHEVTAVAGPGITAGAPADTTLYQAGSGYRPGMSEIYAEGAGESIPGMMAWAADNFITPFLTADHAHKQQLPKLPDDQYWQWHPLLFKYVPAYKPNRSR